MNLVLNGYSGKIGNVVYEYLKSRNYEFVGLGDKEHPLVEDMIRKADAIIDFSTTKSAVSLFELAIKYKKNMIIGTTGFTEKELQHFADKSKDCGISLFVVYNFLPSIHFIKKLLENLDYEKVLLIESHHKSKADIPSGTAKFLVKNLDEQRVEIISNRTEFFCYEHKINIINQFENIEIAHRCYNKIGYAKGVELALKQLGLFIGLRQEI